MADQPVFTYIDSGGDTLAIHALGVGDAAVLLVNPDREDVGVAVQKRDVESVVSAIRAAAGVAATSNRLPHVVVRNADELRLASGEATVVTGGPDSALLIDGIKYAVSSEDPVVIRPHGPGIDGGTITLTLICGSILGETGQGQEDPDA
ncbi:hypothetical protein [Streptomyces bacillaris]